jgi:raffinose/stachyose/melibiose transport system substrate-binding protein
MKKLVLAVAVVALALVACQKAPEKTTLKFMYYIDATQAGYAEDQALWDKFKAANPDIDLQIEIASSQPYHQKLQAYISAGQLPDVVYMWPTSRDSSKEIQDKKLVKDLREVLPKELLATFSPLALDVNNQSSKILAELPQSFTYTTTVYANAGLLKSLGLAVPKTYDELKALVPKLKAKGIQTLLLPNGDKWPAQSCLFSTIAGRLVGDQFFDDVKAGKVKFTDAGFVKALAFFQQLYKDGIIDKSTVNLGYGEGPGVFASGKAALFVDGDWRVGAYLTDKSTQKALIAPDKQKTDFELVNFPAIPGETNVGTVSAIAGVGLGINKDLTGAKLEAAKKLLEFYYSKEFLTVKWETGAFVPSRQDLTSDKLEPLMVKLPEYYKSIPKTTYVLDGVLDPSVFNPLNDGLQALGLGAKTPEQVAAELQKAQDALLATAK